MITITQDQAFERWDTIPEILREALCSETNSGFLWKTCETEHIPNDKIYAVAKITGVVLMGFLHPEDMAAEVRDSIGIDVRVATSIANAINQRIFAPIRADIDRVYNQSIGGATAPKILEEIRPPIAESIPTSAPATLPAVFPIISTSASISPAPKQESIKPNTEKTSSLDEFARIGKNTASSLSPTPAPKPVVLQTESVPRPISNAPNFKIPTIAENVMSGQKGPGQLPTKAAVVEFGGVPIPKPAPQSFAVPKVTIGRYGSENSAAPATPPKPEPMRTVTEITLETLKTIAPIPKAPPQPSFAPLSQIPIPSPVATKPPATPAPSTPPVPPKPMPQIPKPAGQPEKIIQKNYSGEGK